MTTKPRNHVTKSRPKACKDLRVSVALKRNTKTKGRKSMKNTEMQVPMTRERIQAERQSMSRETFRMIEVAVTEEEIDQARILAFAFVEAARIVANFGQFVDLTTPEIGEEEKVKVKEMMLTVIPAKLKHAGLMVLLNTAQQCKYG
jgi:hypothetical protein